MYLRYRSNLVITKAECYKSSTSNNLSLVQCRNCFQGFAIVSRYRENHLQKCPFCFSSFFSITYNSKTIGHIQMFYIRNKSYAIGDLPFLEQSFMRARDPNTHCCLFLTHHFVHILSINQKLWHACNCATHQTTHLLPRMLCSMLKVAKQLQATSYGLVQTLPCCYLCAITIDNKTLGVYDFSTQQTTLYRFNTRMSLCTCIARYDLRAPYLMNPVRSHCKVLLSFLIGLGVKNFLQNYLDVGMDL